jgi:hypothetical protein
MAHDPHVCWLQKLLELTEGFFEKIETKRSVHESYSSDGDDDNDDDDDDEESDG